jgi:hypothetical protein
LTDEHVDAAREWAATGAGRSHPGRRSQGKQPRVRDAAYVLDLCDELLGEKSQREHTFRWLHGDPKPSNNKRNRLPVDAYYERHQLVIEYRERQHDEAVPFFDKPGKPTISGVDRRAQRRRYDQRRDTEIPAHGLKLLVIKPSDLNANTRGRLRRDHTHDHTALKELLDRALGGPDATSG